MQEKSQEKVQDTTDVTEPPTTEPPKRKRKYTPQTQQSTKAIIEYLQERDEKARVEERERLARIQEIEEKKLQLFADLINAIKKQ